MEQSDDTTEEILTLENQIELTAGRAQALFDFLLINRGLLEYISIRDRQDTEEALRDIFRLIAAYGRKVQEERYRAMPDYKIGWRQNKSINSINT